MKNCYTMGAVVGTAGIGAIVGTINPGTTEALIENCYYVGSMDNFLLGKAGDSETTGITLKNCYGTGTAPLVAEPFQITIADSNRKTEAELRGLSAVMGSAFGEDYLVQNDLFPVLSWENRDCAMALTLKNGVYEIGTAEELRLLSYLVRKGNTFSKKKICLTNNIDLEGKSFMAIGGSTDGTSYYFRGHFDGDGHVIRNINCVEMSAGRVGLFGMTNGATIENVGVESGVIIGHSYVAGLAGYMNSTTVRSCYNKATVYGNSKSAGIAGALAGKGSVTDCYNVGLVLAEGTDKNTGGIFGNAADSTKVSISATDSYTYLKEHLNTDNFLTVTLPISEAFRETEVIGRIRIYLGGVESMDGEQGVFVIDYVYIGPETTLPAPVCKVEFANQDGRILQSTYVPQGENAVYYGSVPKKPRDETNHYTFAGWDKSLNNMEEDTVFTATFTATAHNYSYTKVDSKNHKASCSCGYSKTVSHTWDSGKVTTASTCTETGVKTYTCTACKATKTETVPALGHDYKYADNGDGPHIGTCTRCEDVFTEGHKFTGETCFCGGKVLTLDENIKIYHTLDLASDISITFAVPQTALASYDSYHLEVVLPAYEGNVLTGTSTVQIQPVVNGKYYYFTLTGITAVRMGDMTAYTQPPLILLLRYPKFVARIRSPNFDRCHVLLLAVSATGGARNRLP